MRFRFSFGLALLFGCALALPARAHHAHGVYVPEFGDLEGVVREVHLLNPHSWVYLEVENAEGEPEMWAIEATSKGGLERMGVDVEYLKPGDRVKARCHFLRDGSTGCLAGFLKHPDGEVLDWDGGNAELPDDF